MLLNLKTEIARARTSQNKIAELAGMDPKTLSKKILEKNDFTRPEMYAIAKLFPDVSMEYLFASDMDA